MREILVAGNKRLLIGKEPKAKILRVDAEIHTYSFGWTRTISFDLTKPQLEEMLKECEKDED